MSDEFSARDAGERSYTAEEMSDILDKLSDSFGDEVVVDENNNTIGYIDYDPVDEKFILMHGN